MKSRCDWEGAAVEHGYVESSFRSYNDNWNSHHLIFLEIFWNNQHPGSLKVVYVQGVVHQVGEGGQFSSRKFRLNSASRFQESSAPIIACLIC